MLSLSHNHHNLTNKDLSAYICHVNGLLYFMVVESEAFHQNQKLTPVGSTLKHCSNLLLGLLRCQSLGSIRLKFCCTCVK